ncbi:MAG TPA: carbon storage regulator [Alphaproteobacteria bacterium]|nr:carbon storage regulator [Alphaproteobacteria bacterium]
MLYLTRKLGQSIIVNGNIEMKLVEVKGKTVKIGFEFPKDATILRKEVYDKVVEQNKQAAIGSASEEGKDDYFK